MKLVVFFILFCALSFLTEAQKAYDPNKYYFKWESYLPEPKDDGTCPDCLLDKGFIGQQRLSDKVWLCVQVVNPPKAKKTFTPKDPKMGILNGDVEGLKSDMVTVKGDISDIKSSMSEINEKLDASNLKPTADTVTPNPNVDKEQTNYSPNFSFPPNVEGKKDTTINPCQLDVFLIGGYDRVNNPAFTSRNTWNAGAGSEFRINGMALVDTFKREKDYSIYQNSDLFLGAGYQIGFGNNYGIDRSRSALKMELKNSNGFIFKAGLGYRVLPFARVYLGYGISPNKDLSGQGLLAGVQMGIKKIPLKIQAGASYKNCIEYSLKMMFGFNVLKPKA